MWNQYLCTLLRRTLATFWTCGEVCVHYINNPHYVSFFRIGDHYYIFSNDTANFHFLLSKTTLIIAYGLLKFLDTPSCGALRSINVPWKRSWKQTMHFWVYCQPKRLSKQTLCTGFPLSWACAWAKVQQGNNKPPAEKRRPTFIVSCMLRASIITERMKRVTVVGSGFMSRHVEKEILLAANFFFKRSLCWSPHFLPYWWSYKK